MVKGFDDPILESIHVFGDGDFACTEVDHDIDDTLSRSVVGGFSSASCGSHGDSVF